MSTTPLFIPLKREFFEAFKRGDKDKEYRPLGPRWNARTCTIGRPVVLSLGYGKAHRLTGVITGFTTHQNPQLLPGWSDCYRDHHNMAAVIEVTVNSPKNSEPT